MKILAILSAALLFLAQTPPARGEAPRVMADIAPVHGLVAAVTDGVAEPGLLVPPTISPHDYHLKPSTARALAEAALVVWTGPELSAALERAIAALAGKAQILTLLDVPGTTIWPVREPDALGTEAAQGEHEGDHDHDHAAGGRDPHAWLDPANGVVWTDAIAGSLATIDPANAARYRANADAATAAIRRADEALAEAAAALGDRPILVFHDAFQYLERRYDLPVMGALTASDATRPGAGHLAKLRGRIGQSGLACIFVPPNARPALADAVSRDTGARVIIVDPLGSGLAPGPQFYPALLESLVEALRTCAEAR